MLLILLCCAVAVLARRPAPQCRNHVGRIVDWWVIYKRDNGKRYLYYDSYMASQANGQDAFLPVRTFIFDVTLCI